ncbi:MAG TPA: cupin domain-containing protein [Solirubrobacterales bacterium]
MATVIGPGDGKAGFLGSIGVRFMINGEDAGGDFSLVEHPLSPRALAAPLHRHSREDEYSFVLEGRMGGLLGDEVVEAGPGELVFKPRNEWHTFWNAGDEPCRILEIIAPAGFEHFFEELVDMGGALKADPEQLAELAARYGHQLKLESVPELLERFNLVVGEPMESVLQLA